MTDDARFEDAHEAPLRLQALDADDLQVLSALVQDAVFPVTEITWQPAKRRLGLLLNRFRWEDSGRRTPERVQSLLVVNDVQAVASSGIDRSDKDTILSVLSLSFEAGADGTGQVLLTLAGDGALRVRVETLDVALKDVTRPYVAPSGRRPGHPD
jgi:hypothetical protein